jgi:Domain of unknown function (DUF6378)
VNRTEILQTANTYITVDRAATHGRAEANFTIIAGAWQAYLDGRAEIGPADVAAMMAIFKMCRTRHNPKHLDSWLDGAGYCALGGEIASEESSK